MGHRIERERAYTMDDTFQTYLTEEDVLRRVETLTGRGISFVPMTFDEITLAGRLCSQGRLIRSGNIIQLPYH